MVKGAHRELVCLSPRSEPNSSATAIYRCERSCHQSMGRWITGKLRGDGGEPIMYPRGVDRWPWREIHPVGLAFDCVADIPPGAGNRDGCAIDRHIPRLLQLRNRPRHVRSEHAAAHVFGQRIDVYGGASPHPAEYLDLGAGEPSIAPCCDMGIIARPLERIDRVFKVHGGCLTRVKPPEVGYAVLMRFHHRFGCLVLPGGDVGQCDREALEVTMRKRETTGGIVVCRLFSVHEQATSLGRHPVRIRGGVEKPALDQAGQAVEERIDGAVGIEGMSPQLVERDWRITTLDRHRRSSG